MNPPIVLKRLTKFLSMGMLQVLLHRLEESVSEQTEVDQRVPAEQDDLDSLNIEEAADGQQPQTGMDEAAIREFLSAKNLKNVRNDSSRRSSGCFGRRMDRIGSMSSLGCNTVGRYSKLQYIHFNKPQHPGCSRLKRCNLCYTTEIIKIYCNGQQVKTFNLPPV